MNERMKEIIYMWLGVAYFASLPTGVAYAQAIADPMRPPVVVSTVQGPRHSGAPSGPRLTAVFFNGTRRVAVIDGKVVGEGDSLNGSTVTEIFIDGVRLTRAGQAQTMRLPKTTVPVKTRAAVESES